MLLATYHSAQSSGPSRLGRVSFITGCGALLSPTVISVLLFFPPSLRTPPLILVSSTCRSFDSSDHRQANRQANGSVASSPFQHTATTPMLHQRWITHSSVLHRRKRFTASYPCVRILCMSKSLLESAGLVLQASDFAWHKRGEKTPPPPLLSEGRELSKKSC